MNDVEEPVPIPSGKGFGRGRFCAGSDLSNRCDDAQIAHGYDNESFEQNPYDELKVQETDANLESNDDNNDNGDGMGIFKRGLYFLCGIEKQQKQDNVEVVEEKVDVSIDEDPFWSSICDLNAILAMAAAGFAYGFFNKYS
jgi:hypothetical protein